MTKNNNEVLLNILKYIKHESSNALCIINNNLQFIKDEIKIAKKEHIGAFQDLLLKSEYTTCEISLINELYLTEISNNDFLFKKRITKIKTLGQHKGNIMDYSEDLGDCYIRHLYINIIQMVIFMLLSSGFKGMHIMIKFNCNQKKISITVSGIDLQNYSEQIMINQHSIMSVNIKNLYKYILMNTAINEKINLSSSISDNNIVYTATY